MDVVRCVYCKSSAECINETLRIFKCNTCNKEFKTTCDGCHLWGLCDHQGAYKTKEGKWCFEQDERD